MEKIKFNEETQLYLKVEFTRITDVMEAHKILLTRAGMCIGVKWYEVIAVKVKINKRSASLVFERYKKYKTEPGSGIKLFWYYSDTTNKPAGSVKEGLVEVIEERNGQDVVFADCQSSYHSLQCVEFTEIIDI